MVKIILDPLMWMRIKWSGLKQIPKESELGFD